LINKTLPGKGKLVMEGIVTDVRLALRGLRMAPGFAVAAVLILALGVGANVTAFGALRIAVLAQPPFPDPDSLVSVDLTRGVGDEERYSRWAYPYLRMLEGRDDRLIDPIAGYRTRVATLTERGPAIQVPMEIVSPDYFEVVGQPMTIGRGFGAEGEDPSGQHRVAVVSDSFWRTTLGGNAAAIGEELRLNGEPFLVIGVAPRGFSGFAGGSELWVPHGAYDVIQPGVLDQPYNHVAWVVGRLHHGASLEAADAQMRIIGDAVAEEWPMDTPYGAGARALEELWEEPEAQAASKYLAMASGLVLFVACANLSGLMLARARRKVHEGAVRRALGASRWRLIRAFLAESLTVATLGGICGLVVSVWGTRALRLAWPSQFQHRPDTGLQVVDPESLAIDSSAIIFALAVSIAAALLIGLIPALRASGEGITSRLKEGGRLAGRRRKLAGMDGQAALVGIQVCIAVLLLVSVGLVGASVQRLLAVDEGFRTERILTFDYSKPAAVPRLDPTDEEAWRVHINLSAQFDDRMIERVTTLPGVEAMTTSANTVMGGYQAVLSVTGVEGGPELPEAMSIGVNPVADQYFETLGIPILEGRGFRSSDGLDGEPVVILSEKAAATLFPDQSPIGRRVGIVFTLPGRLMAEVVGVAGEVLYMGPDREGLPVAYFSTRERRFGSHAMVRTMGRPEEMIQVIRNEIFAMDPTVAMSNIATMEELIGRSIGDRRIILALLGIFAAITVGLVAAGTWGLVAYSVADRQRELGLRIALGAEPTSVQRLVVRKSMGAGLAGVILGLAGAWAGSRLLESFLWEVSPREPLALLAGASLLLAVVLLASYLPARRATRADPIQVLRN
jgi:putative ABC transport system permease protein